MVFEGEEDGFEDLVFVGGLDVVLVVGGGSVKYHLHQFEL